jgi:hypothetical protein
MTSYAYVYVPKNGEVWALETYCQLDNSGHIVVGNAGDSGFGDPVDVGDTSWAKGDDILFRATSDILSFKVVRFDKICSDLTAPWTNGLKLELYTGYNATGQQIGEVLYGHLKNPLSNGVIKNKPTLGWAEYLGEMPADCDCGCSTGIHVHMECKGGNRNSSLICPQGVNTSTWLYRWVNPF